MAKFLADPLPGFDPATQALDSLEAQDVQYLAIEVSKAIMNRACQLSAEYLAERLAGNGEERERNRPLNGSGGATGKVQQAVNACMYIFRDAIAAKVGADDLGGLLEEATDLSAGCRQALARVWRLKHGLLTSPQKAASGTSVGQLVGMEWKLSVATESSICTGLSTPFVVLLFSVCNPNGIHQSVPVEMTLGEFEEFAQSVDEMAAVLETV